MKKLFKKMFDDNQKAKQEKQISQNSWTFENNGWEASARRYNQKHNLRVDEV